MHVYDSLTQVGNKLAQGVIAIGNFDGIHRGHQALITQVCMLAQNKPKGVLTFSPHPQQVLYPDKNIFYLTNNQQRINIFSKLGLDIIILLNIDKNFLELTPEEFIDKILVKSLQVSHVVVGDDFRFGLRAMGDTSLLQAQKFTTHIISPVIYNSYRCSSTNIRDLLILGDLEQANNLLGRNFSYMGQVTRGQGRGSVLGFKTANIKPAQDFLLKRGVYATVVRYRLDSQTHDVLACTNVGVRPSVTSHAELIIESHLFDTNLDLYNHTIEVFFVERIRDENKFDSVKSLVAQVQSDFQTVRQIHRQSPARFRLAS